MTVGEVIENLIYIKGTCELREWEVETINEACNALSQQKGKPMTNLDLLNTLKKTTDCIRQKYPNQVKLGQLRKHLENWRFVIRL